MRTSLVRNGVGQLKVTPGRWPQPRSRRVAPEDAPRRAAFVRADIAATLEREGRPLTAEALFPLLRGADHNVTAVDAALAELEAAGRVTETAAGWVLVGR